MSTQIIDSIKAQLEQELKDKQVARDKQLNILATTDASIEELRAAIATISGEPATDVRKRAPYKRPGLGEDCLPTFVHNGSDVEKIVSALRHVPAQGIPRAALEEAVGIQSSHMSSFLARLVQAGRVRQTNPPAALRTRWALAAQQPEEVRIRVGEGEV
jgi:anti-sigma factor RsiW